MWQGKWRDEVWAAFPQEWDIIIIGGGITGAGILREATRLGLKVLLVEQKDFAWGTSSRSSKLVHGGLRYLKEGRFRLTRASVHEREQLLREGPGLIEPLDFLLANYDGDSAGRITYGMGLTIYDLLALRWSHRYYSAQDFRLMAGQITQKGLEGGYRYGDAQTDDARLVLRVIREAVADGGKAINYVKASQLLRDEVGNVSGLRLEDQASGRSAQVYAPIVINATGAWADQLRNQLGKEDRIRPLRGSHLIIPSWRLPVAQAISFAHPNDQRPVFLFPWEGVTLIGTTDVDYEGSLNDEPGITPAEVSYLMAAIDARYPMLGIELDDVISTFAGVRPVLGSGKENPSEESRDHVIWEENGLITVTGGKLTTFRLVALEVLRRVQERLVDLPEPDKDMPMLNAYPDSLAEYPELDDKMRRRLVGRYGADAKSLVQSAQVGELEKIPETDILWAEIRWAAHAEGVMRLDDLLLRRVRLGLVVPEGGKTHFPRIQAICEEELGWDDARWHQEESSYLNLWHCCYSLPNRSAIPDWRTTSEKTKEGDGQSIITVGKPQNKLSPILIISSLVFFLAIFISILLIPKLRRRSRTTDSQEIDNADFTFEELAMPLNDSFSFFSSRE